MWTAAALASEARSFAAELWRIVEDQSFAATIRITDTIDDQALLERLLDDTKPLWPREVAGYDFLIATPFRYRPYPFGSRFRRARQPEGVYYASEAVETAAAELAFFRLLFFLESPGARHPASPVQHTAFSIRAATERAIDLTKPPLDGDRGLWTHPTDYGPCQGLADEARQAGLQAIRYESVRDPRHGANAAILAIAAIADRTPRARQSWRFFVRASAVQAWCESPRLTLEFPWSGWRHDPQVAALAGHQ